MTAENSVTGSSWADFQRAEPAFAATVQARFAKYLHHVLATLRKDGSPRVTGLEVIFREDQLWLGMMPDSLKARDLLRDPRFALHANPGTDGSMDGGDVRLSGRAVEITDQEELARFAAAIEHPLPFHLFRVELSDVVRSSVDGDEMVLQSWHPAAGLVTRRRR
ncbi:pyridoxamine 5'-phosphate oxidase family protein [Streptomyces albipurpureus]|uniref:Pyridoxamine 5'-phosphate oxidase family protein n=1 Tax=Streptomyces albipurpureus TaxID=2897419 RepID=A0ABT0UR11_9ACTN|nr:pyridoxamine 5'-phosphate oxidase family protein [Streptomyces sp. CWNU-1]MCM2390781.1 pyridoxamine 5'-phosphate oxidase family protein [Streptomyces sp. CWNU-1]